MCILFSHIVTTALVAICEGNVQMIFSWSSKGTYTAPLENNDIYVHLHTSFPVILYPGHFIPMSFRTQVISHNVVHFVPCSFLALLDVGIERNILTKFEKIRPVVLEEMRWQENVYRYTEKYEGWSKSSFLFLIQRKVRIVSKFCDVHIEIKYISSNWMLFEKQLWRHSLWHVTSRDVTWHT